MAYTNAIFYLKPLAGNDAARTTLTNCIASNPSGSTVNIYKVGHGLITGAVVTLSLFTSYLNSAWKITRIDDDNFTLDNATWAATADADGSCVPFGGMSWDDAWSTMTSGATSARLGPGDVVRIAKSPAPTSLGQSATWTNQSRTVTLTTAVTEYLYGEGAWTTGSGANCVCTSTTDRKEGANSATNAIQTGHTTGIASYFATSSSLDLSGYQQISFWIKTNSAMIANYYSLRLCSDTAGTTSQNTILIPAVPAANTWQQITVDTGGALYNGVQSIALYVETDAGAKTIIIDNVIACKASSSDDALTLSSLISKNSSEQGGTEAWYGIKNINGVTIELDDMTSSNAGAGKGYNGTTETVTTYKRECYKPTPASSTATASIGTINDSGTESSKLEFQGGYDTGTNLQTGDTFIDGQNGYGMGINSSSKSNFVVKYLSVVRFYRGLYFTASSYNNISVSNISNCTVYGLYVDSFFNTFPSVNNVNNNSTGIYISNSTGAIFGPINNINNNTTGLYIPEAASVGTIFSTINNINNNTTGIQLQTGDTSIQTITNCNYNSSYGISFGTNASHTNIETITNLNNNGTGILFNDAGATDNVISEITNCNNNSNYGIYFFASSNNFIRKINTTGNSPAVFFQQRGEDYVYESTHAEATISAGAETNWGPYIWFDKYNGTDYAFLYTDGGSISSQASTLTAGSGTEWKFSISSGGNRRINYPLKLSVAKIACNASSLVTVKMYFKKDHATNIGARLVFAKQLGADSTYTECPNDTNENELTITFTPTQSGVAKIEAWAYNATYSSPTASVIVDKLTITQA